MQLVEWIFNIRICCCHVLESAVVTDQKELQKELFQ